MPDFAYDAKSPTIVEVGKLFKKRERSRAVRQMLSDVLWDGVNGFVLRSTGDVVHLEVFVQCFDAKADAYTTTRTAPVFRDFASLPG